MQTSWHILLVRVCAMLHGTSPGDSWWLLRLPTTAKLLLGPMIRRCAVSWALAGVSPLSHQGVSAPALVLHGTQSWHASPFHCQIF